MEKKKVKNRVLRIRATDAEREQLHKVAKERGTTISGLLMAYIKDANK